MSKEVVLHLITWNGNTFDLPMWILCTDQVANKRGAWACTFGKVIILTLTLVLALKNNTSNPIFTDYFGIFGLQVGNSKP